MKTEILKSSQQNILKVVGALQNDDVVALPTETVYGLAGRTFSDAALEKIFLAKERPLFDPLICHFPKQMNESPWRSLLKTGLIDTSKLSDSIQQKVETLANQFWPGPLTLVLPKSTRVPDLATSGLPSVGVRCPAHPLFQEVLLKLQEPLSAPSANRFGKISPTSANDVFDELDTRIPFILDGGLSSIGVESTIIGLEEDQFVVYRPGGLALEEIEAVLGNQLKTRFHSDHPVAPGMLKNHYAPTKPFYLFDGTLEALDAKILAEMQEKLAQGKKIALLLARGEVDRVPLAFKNEAQVVIRVLSPQGSSQEAAKNLFRYLREIDQMNIDFILAEQWPYTEVLGFALRDRMNRAAEKLQKTDKTP